MYASRSGIKALTRGSMGAAGLDSSCARVTLGRYAPESTAAIRSGRTMFPAWRQAPALAAESARVTIFFLQLDAIMIAVLPLPDTALARSQHEGDSSLQRASRRRPSPWHFSCFSPGGPRGAIYRDDWSSPCSP